ncbi:MAG: SufE family protein, partial [Pseudomonadota bacterium]|nr:SufE family protein [Pseudomonadota bacterium]
SEGSSDNIQFRGDSDAHIVKGLVAILLSIFSGKSAHEIMEINAQAIFEKLGLKDHLTPQRSNGFYAMVSKIRADAEAFDECRNP